MQTDKFSQNNELSQTDTLSQTFKILQFWDRVKNNFHNIYYKIKKGTIDNTNMSSDDLNKANSTIDNANSNIASDLITNSQAMEGLRMLNDLLPDEFKDKVEIEATYGEINRLQLEISKDLLEIYISPKYDNKNIQLINEIYKYKPDIANLKVAKYKAYKQVNNDIPNSLTSISRYHANSSEYENENFTVNYDDFGCQGSYSYENGKPFLNLLIIVNEKVANKFLVKRKIQFESNKTREVYMQEGFYPIDIYLNYILGEYIMLNYVGYIEILPSDHVYSDQIENSSQTKKTESEKRGETESEMRSEMRSETGNETAKLNIQNGIFTELTDIKKHVMFVLKARGNLNCNYCNHDKLQVDLFKCGRCKKTYYCSRLCQKVDYMRHKKVCKQNLTN
jgi:hypothetical protein